MAVETVTTTTRGLSRAPSRPDLLLLLTDSALEENPAVLHRAAAGMPPARPDLPAGRPGPSPRSTLAQYALIPQHPFIFILIFAQGCS
jgi:hypothetical protein